MLKGNLIMYKVYLNLFNKSLSSLNPLFSSMSLKKIRIKIDIRIEYEDKYLFKYFIIYYILEIIRYLFIAILVSCSINEYVSDLCKNMEK